MRRQRLREPEAKRRVPGVVRQPDRRLRLELAAEAVALARGLAPRIVGLEGIFGQAAGERRQTRQTGQGCKRSAGMQRLAQKAAARNRGCSRGPAAH
jgi:hypothetical protein